MLGTSCRCSLHGALLLENFSTTRRRCDIDQCFLALHWSIPRLEAGAPWCWHRVVVAYCSRLYDSIFGTNEWHDLTWLFCVCTFHFSFVSLVYHCRSVALHGRAFFRWGCCFWDRLKLVGMATMRCQVRNTSVNNRMLLLVCCQCVVAYLVLPGQCLSLWREPS